MYTQRETALSEPINPSLKQKPEKLGTSILIPDKGTIKSGTLAPRPDCIQIIITN